MEGIGGPPPRDGPRSADRTAGRDGERAGGRVASVCPVARPRTGPRPIPRRDSTIRVALAAAARDAGRPPELHGELSVFAHRGDGVREPVVATAIPGTADMVEDGV